MAGKIKQIIDEFVTIRSKGNPVLVQTTRTKLILKGINPDHFNSLTEDNFEIIQKVRLIATEMGITLTK